MNKRELGYFFEQAAIKYLENKNFQLIENNFNTRTGEIDLIMKDQDFTVFVEVKSLNKSNNFYIYETLTKKKKKRIKSSIYTWLNKNDLNAAIWRCDFVGIIYQSEEDYTVEHYKFVQL